MSFASEIGSDYRRLIGINIFSPLIVSLEVPADLFHLCHSTKSGLLCFTIIVIIYTHLLQTMNSIVPSKYPHI